MVDCDKWALHTFPVAKSRSSATQPPAQACTDGPGPAGTVGGNLGRTFGNPLSPTAIAERQHCIGASEAGIIADGGLADLEQLKRQKLGLEGPVDLTRVLPVQIGVATEELNRAWFEAQTGRIVTREQERIVHPDYSFIAATLDGVTVNAGNQTAVLECKHVGERFKLADIVKRYYPQIQHQLMVTGYHYACLSVFFGNKRWEMVEIDSDFWYQNDLLAAEKEFWQTVENGRANLP